MLVLRPADAVEAAECWEDRVRASSRAVDARLRRARRCRAFAACTPARTCRGAAPTCSRGRGRAARSHAAGDRLRGGARARAARDALHTAGTPDRRGCRCRAGSCSRRRTRTIARACSAPAPCASGAKRRSASAGNR
jgi:hypothetical protein